MAPTEETALQPSHGLILEEKLVMRIMKISTFSHHQYIRFAQKSNSEDLRASLHAIRRSWQRSRRVGKRRVSLGHHFGQQG